MLNTHQDCPHCGAHGSVPSGNVRRLLLPVAWITAFISVFCMALTTVILLMTAPLLFVVAFCLIGGIHQWIGEADQCGSCGKLVLSAAQLRRMGPVRVVQTQGGAEREVPIPTGGEVSQRRAA